MASSNLKSEISNLKSPISNPPSPTPSSYERHEHHEFLAATDAALADASLQLILHRMGDTLGARNRQAFAEFAESGAVRDRARAIKDATLAELDKHLETLDASVTRRGGHVHYAADGSEACQ